MIVASSEQLLNPGYMMLNRAERYRTLKSYRILSIVGFQLVEVDLTNSKLTASTKRKRWICFLFLGILVFQMLYKNGSLAYAYLFDPNVQLHQLVVHAVLAMAAVMTIYFYAVVYISDYDLFALYVNVTLLGNVGGNTGFPGSQCMTQDAINRGFQLSKFPNFGCSGQGRDK